MGPMERNFSLHEAIRLRFPLIRTEAVDLDGIDWRAPYRLVLSQQLAAINPERIEFVEMPCFVQHSQSGVCSRKNN